MFAFTEIRFQHKQTIKNVKSEWKKLIKLTKPIFCLESPGKFFGLRVLAMGRSGYWKRRFFFFPPRTMKRQNNFDVNLNVGVSYSTIWVATHIRLHKKDQAFIAEASLSLWLGDAYETTIQLHRWAKKNYREGSVTFSFKFISYSSWTPDQIIHNICMLPTTEPSVQTSLEEIKRRFPRHYLTWVKLS